MKEQIIPECVDEKGNPIIFVNHYHCKRCQKAWDDIWSCQVDDECNWCGKYISPESSTEIPYVPQS